MTPIKSASLSSVLRAFVAVWLAAMVCPPGAVAHEVRPLIADMVLAPDGAVRLTISANAEAMVAGIGADHEDTDDAPEAARYAALRAMAPDSLRRELEQAQDRILGGIRVTTDAGPIMLEWRRAEIPEAGNLSLARVSEIVLEGRLPEAASTLRWQLVSDLGDSVIRVWKAGADDPFAVSYVAAGDATPDLALIGAARSGTWDVVRAYLIVGFEHIVPKGLDHILFVLGLFLLSPRLRPLLLQVTMFTLAHTVTLALGVTGTVQVEPRIVEPLIALSIVYVAVDNIRGDRLGTWRPAVVFAFGLLHGLGFAGVLAEYGLPDGQFVPALIAFNVGVELGQLAVIAAAFLAVGLWFGGREWYRRAVVIPGSVVIAAVALYWVAERTGVVA